MTWALDNADRIAELTWQHLVISVLPILLAVLVSVPLGRVAIGVPWLRSPIVAGTGILYAIPSLPLLVTIPVITGFPLRSTATLQSALLVYAIALLVRGAADAFQSVSSSTRQAADALGFTWWSRFWRLELPLAGPVIVAALRVVVVSTVSLVTIGAVLGIPSLGSLLTDGFQRGIGASIAAGIVMTVLVAFLLDLVCVLVARALMPWQHHVRAGGA